MNPYLFLTAAAFFANGIILAYIFMRRNKAPVSDAFLLVTSFAECWILCTFLFRLNLNGNWITPVLRGNSIFWLSIGFLFLNFIYVFINRKKDIAYYFFAASLICAGLVSVSSAWTIKGYLRFAWGYVNDPGPMYYPFIAIVVLLPIIYGLVLIGKEMKRTVDRKRSAQLRMFKCGAVAAMVVGVSSQVLVHIPTIAAVFPHIAAESTVIMAFAGFWAIIRYDFLTLGVQNIAQDLFVHIHDGVLIMDDANRVVQANRSALQILGKTKDDVVNYNISDVLPELADAVEDMKPFGVKIEVEGGIRQIQGTWVHVNQKGACQGKILFIQDETERIMTMEALRSSEDRLHRIFDYAHDGINIVEYDMKSGSRRLIMCNESFVRMSGFTQEELMSTGDLNKLVTSHYYLPGSPIPEELTVENIVKDKLVFRGVSSWNRPDGQENLYEWTSVPWVVDDRFYIVGIDRDITDRMKADKALRESEERYKRLVENSPDAILVYGDGKILFANLAAAKLHGAQSPTELLGMTLLELIHPSRRGDAEKNYAAAEAFDPAKPLIYPNGEMLIEETLLRLDGSIVYAEIAPMPIQFQGRLATMIMARDITQRKKIEDAFHESEQRLHLLFDFAFDGINIVRFDVRNNVRRLVMCNDSFVRMSGYTREALMASENLNDLTILHHNLEGYPDMSEFSLEEIDRKELVFRGVSSWKRPDGKENLYEWAAVPCMLEGKLYLMGIDRDITEQKISERNLKESEERYRRLVDASPEAIVVHDGQSIRYVNMAGARMFGTETPEKMIGTPVLSYVHPDSRKIASDRIAKSQKEMIDQPLVEEKFIHADGTPFDVEVATMHFVFEGKNCVQVMVRDITERKRIEQALIESEAKYRLMFDHSPDAILLIEAREDDPFWPIIDCNDTACVMNGFKREELVGQSIDMLHGGVRSAKERKAYYNQLMKEKRVYAQTIHKRSDGEEIYIESNGHLVTISGKQFLLGIDRDITERVRAELALRESEERYRTLFDRSPDGIFLIEIREDDSFWPIIDCNETACLMNGYTREELIGQPVDLFNVEMGSFGERRSFLENLRKNRSRRYEAHHRRKDGTAYNVEIVVHLITMGKREIILGIDRDITERKQASDRIKVSEARYRTLFDNSPDGIILIEPRGNDPYWPILDCNEAACQMNGYSRDEMVGMHFDRLNRDRSDHKTIMKGFERLRREKIVRSELYHTRKDGSVFPIETTTNLIEIDGKEVILGIDRDVSDRKKAEETIRHQMYHDQLTELPNRMLFTDRLSLALANSHRNGGVFSVIFLNLDRFKTINDTLGHVVGDRLLMSVSERLNECLREGDTLARLSGDSFTLLLPQVQRVEDVAKLAQDIQESFKQPFILSGMELYITVSMGIALYPNDGDDVDSLLKNADTALHRAKEQGRNTYQFYTPLMNAKASEHLALESSLRRALSREEFLVYYQPQIDTYSKKIIGVEALVRWRHPDLGLVSPAEFIPMAEETGLIVPIGAWVMRTACAQSKAWQQMGLPPVLMAVNLSARQFQQKDLVQMIAGILGETGLDSGLLEVEITESIAMQNADYTISVLRELKEMGIRISLDDFGTGYSSLNYLKKFPIHTLKIDKSFVFDLTTDPNDAAIAKAVIALAHSLNLHVMAEGVETEAQVEFLKTEKCDKMQGFLFGRPIPAAEMQRILESQK